MQIATRMKLIAAVAVLAGLPLIFYPTSQVQAKTEAAEPMKLKVGDMAPDFSLMAFDGKGLNKISLHDYRGKKNVALAFYVFAFTGG